MAENNATTIGDVYLRFGTPREIVKDMQSWYQHYQAAHPNHRSPSREEILDELSLRLTRHIRTVESEVRLLREALKEIVAYDKKGLPPPIYGNIARAALAPSPAAAEQPQPADPRCTCGSSEKPEHHETSCPLWLQHSRELRERSAEPQPVPSQAKVEP